MNKAKRNYGIDLFRVVSLIGVIILHILGHGGVLDATEQGLNYQIIWLLELLAFPAVNCFVLISGFVGYKSEKSYPKLKNIISLFFTVIFYCTCICVAIQLISPDNVDIFDLFQSFFPVLTKQYWFFTMYFAVFLLSPMLNLLVNKANAEMLGIGFVTIVILSFSDTLTDIFVFKNGYSVIWFMALYLIGAIMKKYDIANKISVAVSVIGAAAMLIFTWLMKIYLPTFSIGILGISNIGDKLVSYCSPAMLMLAIFLLCLFNKMKISKKLNPVIAFLSSSAFSVYLIHENKHIRRLLIKDNFEFLAEKNPFVTIALVIAFAIGIYLICTFADKLRMLIFKLFKVDTISAKLEDIIKSLFKKCFAFLTDKTSHNT